MPEFTKCKGHEAVYRGNCVIVELGKIVYAGPVRESPDFDDLSPDAVVLVNPADFAVLRELVQRRTN